METFLVRTNGGPYAGTRVANADGAVKEYDWPLPNEFDAPGGKYVKIRESQLPEQPVGSFVMRGAEYEWQANVDT